MTEMSEAFRFRMQSRFEDIVVDEVDMRPSAREGSVGRASYQAHNAARRSILDQMLISNLRPRI